MFMVKENFRETLEELGVFKNISCLRLRKKMLNQELNQINLKTFHVYG